MIGRPPAGTVTSVAGGIAGVTAFVLLSENAAAMVIAGVGLLVLVASAVVVARRLADVGGAILFAVILLGGVTGTGAATILAASVATLLAWTWTTTAVGLWADLGSAPSGGLESAHVTGTTVLAVGPAVLGFVLFTAPWGRIPPLAVVFFVIGAVALVAALRRAS